jgi:hypothetical protein
MSGLLSNQHRILRSALASCGVGMHRAFSYNDVAETFESSFSYKKKFSSSFLLLLQRIVRYWEQNKYENCNSMQTKKIGFHQFNYVWPSVRKNNGMLEDEKPDRT